MRVSGLAKTRTSVCMLAAIATKTLLQLVNK